MPEKNEVNLDTRLMGPKLGLYLHIPWCKQICHYCDFAKTANHNIVLREKFLHSLESHLSSWINWNSKNGGPDFSSVFFGGGTPSVYNSEYADVLSLILRRCQKNAEVTLEANPDDITTESLRIWRDLGFNRISIGVQTFDDLGLKAMHRVHSKDQALVAVETALKVFPTVNIDLIYGWQGQTASSWQKDLKTALSLDVPHLSLYNLTYEPRTVIGRMAARGRLEPADELSLEAYYRVACDYLAGEGFLHEEVSNWCKPNHSCAHNWLYWSDQSYIGVGPGAHGYLSDANGIGTRYAYARNERAFIDMNVERTAGIDSRALPISEVVIEEDRTVMSWIIEVIGSSLRTERGVDLAMISEKSRLPFRFTNKLEAGLKSGALKMSDDNRRIVSTSSEWFREHYWALAIIAGFE